MEIEGSVGRLSKEEQRATGYGPEVLVAQMRIDALLRDVEVSLGVPEDVPTSDDGKVPQDERASLAPNVAWQYRRREVISTLAGQVLAYECGVYLESRQV